MTEGEEEERGQAREAMAELAMAMARKKIYNW
jgi:hypothetical protein